MTSDGENAKPDDGASGSPSQSETPEALFEARHPDGRKTFLEKWSTIVLCTTLFMMPLVIMGSLKSLKVYASSVRQWLPQGFDEAEIYDTFVERFGIDEMVVVSWDNCQLGNPEVLDFQQALESLQLDDDPDSQDFVFSRVVSGPDLLLQIQDAGVSRRTALKRLQGLMIGPDGKTTCILAYPVKDHHEHRRAVVDRVYQLAEQQFGIPPESLRLGGPTVDGAAIETESKKALGTFLWMSVVLVFLLTWFRLRDLPLTLLVISNAALCASISLSILYWTGGKMNLTMVMLPTLTFILGVSGSVHMVNYYHKAALAGFGMSSADRALADGAYPIALSAATTAVGMLSLATSHVTPIRLFGFYSACGILSSIGVILFVLPSALYFFRGRITKRYAPGGKMRARERATGVNRSTSLLLHWVCRSHSMVVIPSLIAITIIGIGIFQLGASVKLQNRFSQRAKIIGDYQWLETNLGPLVPMEVVMHFGPENQLSRWDQMRMVKSVEYAVKQTTAVNATLSVAMFEPKMPRGKRLTRQIEQKTVLNVWNNQFSKFEDAKLVKIEGGDSYWRISLRVAALNDIDYGGFLGTVSENVVQQIEHLNQPDVDVLLTGGIPLVYKAQHQILSDLTYSFLTAFLIITLILIFVLRSVRAGIVAMIPNLFPPLVVFGGMGWLGFSIEIGSVMTASVALGIAVDDTLHFLTWYRRGTMDGLSRYASIRFAFEHCAKPMIDTSLICGLGVLPFLFGVFMPTVKFALLLMIMLFAALLGDLILLPAILAGPAGLLFRLKRKKTRRRDSSTQLSLEKPTTEPLKTVRRN